MTKNIFTTSIVLLIIFIFHFILIVHPNDRRIDQFDPDQLQPADKRLKEVEKLANKWPTTQFTTSLKTYRNAIDRLSRTTKHRIALSLKPNKKRSIFVTIGSYPEKLEGREAVLIQNRKSVFFQPGIANKVELSIPAISLGGNSALKVLHNGKQIGLHKLFSPANPRNFRGFYTKYFSQYWRVDNQQRPTSWYHLSYKIRLESKDKLKFKCFSKLGNCFVGRPRFIVEELKKKKKNFLVIVVDTLRADATTKLTAPTMHRFREQGLDFTRAMSVGNMTSPSSNGLLTCQKPSDIASIGFAYAASDFSRRKFYASNKLSFPALFRKNGWRTAMIGNISVISEVLGVGVDHGFEEQIALERDAYDTATTTREAIRWLDDNGNTPFFLYVHLHAPHAPYRAPLKDIWDTYSGIDDFQSSASLLRWLYRAEVHYTDRYIDKILQAIERLGLESDTEIVLTADHGDHHSFHTFQGNQAGPARTGAFFDHGATLLNDEINIPLAFRSQNPEKIDTLVSNLDIGPTFLKLAGIKVPEWCSGVPLMPTISDHTNRIIGSEGFRRRAIFFEDRYKYTVSYGTTNKTLYEPKTYGYRRFNLFEQEQLIDLQRDPSETNNLAATHPRLLKKARDNFDDYYDVGHLWELVLESPNKTKIEVELDEYLEPIKYYGVDISHKKNKTTTFTMSNNKRALITLRNPPRSLPTVRSGQGTLPLLSTMARIKLASPDQLPVEPKGEHGLLPVGKKPAVYLRKVENSDFQSRRIIAGNPQFEAILKDWGYLNENQTPEN